MNSREVILGRVKEALRVPAHRHAPDGVARQWSAPMPENIEEQIRIFERNALSLKAEFHQCSGVEEAVTLACSYDWKKIGIHDGELSNQIVGGLALPTVKTTGGYAVEELERCDAGVTECDALVAETGSVLVSSVSAGGRALSVLPPHHVVLARREQMVPNLCAALQLARKKYQKQWPSFLSFITGPSRTGDIERILVLGAHGPKRLTILLLP